MKQVVNSIYDITLICECEEIIHVDMKKRHPTRISVNHLAEVEISDGLIHHNRMGLQLAIRTLGEKDRSFSQ